MDITGIAESIAHGGPARPMGWAGRVGGRVGSAAAAGMRGWDNYGKYAAGAVGVGSHEERVAVAHRMMSGINNGLTAPGRAYRSNTSRLLGYNAGGASFLSRNRRALTTGGVGAGAIGASSGGAMYARRRRQRRNMGY